MKNQRIKVFLGGYVNFLNAQNINCRSLSEHLNKNRFEVWTMLLWNQNAQDFQRVPGVHYLKSRRPVRFLWWLPYLIGLLRCDVAYLPKGEHDGFCRFVARLRGCKVFSTLEGVMSGTNLQIILAIHGNLDCYRLFEPNLYGITKYIADQANRDHGLQFQDRVLYLGVEAERFSAKEPRRAGVLSRIVFIGNNTKFKGLEDVLHMARIYPDLEFHCVGGDTTKEGTLEEYVSQHNLENVMYHGPLDHKQLAELLPTMDLMFFPSRSEGFPKVMLETACAGVPTLCYGDYGADEWITTGKDGFVVNTFDEAKAVIQNLVENPTLLQELSKNAIELGKRFDWKVLVKDWEEEIIRIANNKN